MLKKTPVLSGRILIAGIFLSNNVNALEFNGDVLDREAILQKHREVEQQIQAGTERAETLTPVKKVKSEDLSESEDEESFLIKKIEIDQAGENLPIDFSSIIERYENRYLTSTKIFDLARDLTALLYEKGYVTSAISLKDTDVSDGTLKFLVNWGKGNQFLVNGEQPAYWKDRFMLKTLPSVQDKVINIHLIDQMVETLNQQNKSAKISVLAEEGRDGYSNLNITTLRSPYPGLSLGFNNSGAENNANGRNQLTTSLFMSDLLGLNDSWALSGSYRLYKDSTHNSLNNYALSYTQPIDLYVLELRSSVSDYNKRLRGINGHYDSDGTTRTNSIKLSRLVSRSKEYILTAYFQYDRKNKKTGLASRRTGDHNYSDMTVGLSYVSNLLDGKIYADLSYSKGLGWFNGEKTAYNRDNQSKFVQFISSTLNWNKDFRIAQRPFNYTSKFAFQYGTNRTDSSNHFSIGDEYTVRGFKGGVLSGEKGMYLSQTVSLPLYFENPYFRYLSPYVGFDIGKVYSKLTGYNENISSATLGLKFQLGKLFINTMYSKPVNRLDLPKKNRKEIIYVNANLTF